MFAPEGNWRMPEPETPPSQSPPAIADDRDKTLDPASVMAARITGIVWILILAVPFGGFSLLALLFSRASPRALAGLIAGTLILLLLTGWSLFWPQLRYRHTSYRVGQRGLWIRRGVFWRTEISVPKSRVQHTDVSQGPLQRRFGIATLVLHTAGTQHAAVALSGLTHGDALAIRDYLIEVGLDDAV